MKIYTNSILKDFKMLINLFEHGYHEHLKQTSIFTYRVSEYWYQEMLKRLIYLSDVLQTIDISTMNCLLLLLNGKRPSQHLDELGFRSEEECKLVCNKLAAVIGRESYLLLYKIVESKKSRSILRDSNSILLPNNDTVTNLLLPSHHEFSTALYACFESLHSQISLEVSIVDKLFKLTHILFPLMPIEHSLRGVYSDNSILSRWYHPERRNTCILFCSSETEKVEGETHNFYTETYTSPPVGSTDWCGWMIYNSLYEGENPYDVYQEIKLITGDTTPHINDVFKSILINLKIESNQSYHLSKFNINSVIDFKRLVLNA